MLLFPYGGRRIALNNNYSLVQHVDLSFEVVAQNTLRIVELVQVCSGKAWHAWSALPYTPTIASRHSDRFARLSLLTSCCFDVSVHFLCLLLFVQFTFAISVSNLWSTTRATMATLTPHAAEVSASLHQQSCRALLLAPHAWTVSRDVVKTTNLPPTGPRQRMKFFAKDQSRFTLSPMTQHPCHNLRNCTASMGVGNRMLSKTVEEWPRMK